MWGGGVVKSLCTFNYELYLSRCALIFRDKVDLTLHSYFTLRKHSQCERRGELEQTEYGCWEISLMKRHERTHTIQ